MRKGIIVTILFTTQKKKESAHVLNVLSKEFVTHSAMIILIGNSNKEIT